MHDTLQEREADYKLVPASLDQGLGVLVWTPLAGGLLSGKYGRSKDAPEGTCQFAKWDERRPRWGAEKYHVSARDVCLNVFEPGRTT